jgi:V8-like Glu-specific endopeptidase
MTANPAAAAKVGVVLPPDTRQRVAVATNQPACWIGQLESTWPNSPTSTGTATLLDDRHLLTCAHNFYDTALRTYCTSAVFKPAFNRSATGALLPLPYGAYQVLRMAVAAEYVTSGGPRPPANGIAERDITRYLHDYAVARLGRAISDPPGDSMFALGWPGAGPVGQAQCTINGYSGDLDPTGCTQYTRTGAVTVNQEEEFVLYRMSTFDGDSGAPVFYQQQGRNFWTIAAVHVTGVLDSPPGAGNGRNFGPAMNDGIIGEIQQMLNAVDR